MYILYIYVCFTMTAKLIAFKISHLCLILFLTLKYLDAKSLPVLANGSLTEKVKWGNTELLLRVKQVPLDRFMLVSRV